MWISPENPGAAIGGIAAEQYWGSTSGGTVLPHVPFLDLGRARGLWSIRIATLKMNHDPNPSTTIWPRNGAVGKQPGSSQTEKLAKGGSLLVGLQGYKTNLYNIKAP